MSLPYERLLGRLMVLLGLPAASVWAMTPREIAAALRAAGEARPAPPARRDLREMMRRFPDQGDADD